MKKTLSFFQHFLTVTALMTGATHANAYDDYNCYSKDCYSPCEVECNSCGTFSVGADWLYWKVEEQKLNAAAEVHITSSGGESLISSKGLEPKFEYDSGFRVFADYTTRDQLWKVGAAFTRICSKPSVSDSENPANISTDFISIFPVNFPILTILGGTSFSQYTETWDVDINYLDLDLSRTLSLHGCFEIKPHIGLRGVWIDQNATINGVNATTNFTTINKNTLKGIGLEGGLWGNWKIATGFSLVGHIGGSLVYTESKMKSSLTGLSLDAVPLALSSPSYTTALTLPSLDSFIGLAYGSCCYNKVVNLHIGWEHHTILNTNQIAGDGDITLQGLTLGMAVGF